MPDKKGGSDNESYIVKKVKEMEKLIVVANGTNGHHGDKAEDAIMRSETAC